MDPATNRQTHQTYNRASRIRIRDEQARKEFHRLTRCLTAGRLQQGQPAPAGWAVATLHRPIFLWDLHKTDSNELN